MPCRRCPSRARTDRRGRICWLRSTRTATSSPARPHFPAWRACNNYCTSPSCGRFSPTPWSRPGCGITESILQAAADNGEIDASTLTPYTARVGTALVNQQMLLTGAPPNKRQLAQIVDTVLPQLA